MSHPDYPVPTAKPTYTASEHKILGQPKRSLAEIFEYVFVAAAFGLTLWLAWLILLKGTAWSLSMIVWLIVFWALMAYFALPKLHQFFTSLYVPDYFISRTKTGDGLLGDPVNLALEGSAADIHAAMTAAGWTKADDITLKSSLGIVKSSLLRRSYPEAPVSDLFLFGNRQEFAYQQEVDGNAAQRHHIRFWPVPEGWVLPGGHRVKWLAAGTYDRAVGLSLFTGQITHKIDANIDLERDYVINTVLYTDPQTSVSLIKEFSTAYHHRNGGGDTVATDGHLPILDVTGAAQRHQSTATAAEAVEALSTTPNTTLENSKAIITDAVEKRPLPPLPFLLTGGLLLVSALIVLAAWISFAALGSRLENAGISQAELLATGVTVFAMAACWLLTLARLRWARILLIAAALVSAIQELITATTVGSLSVPSLLSAAIALFVLWSVCGQAMSRWIALPKVNSQL